MELVATSKLKRATDRVRAARPYAEALRDIVAGLYSPGLSERYPILRRPEEEKRAAVLLLTANRGLCGGFNSNLIKQAGRLMHDLRGRGIETELHVVGKKGVAYFRFRGEEMVTTRIDVSDHPTVDDAESIIGPIRDRFENGDIDSVYLVSSKFESAMSTPPYTRDLLPIAPDGDASSADVYILTPSGDMILERILPAYIRNAVFTALVENAAAEQGSRRSAMKSATDNAGDVLKHLTRTYNRARQAQITQEIAEIVGGSAALE
jgi:F-type H+-transporting ATPase subunit gamma